jgi:hypothetical protein
VALRVEGEVVVLAPDFLPLALDGVELANTDCPERTVVPGVAPVARSAKAELPPELANVPPRLGAGAGAPWGAVPWFLRTPLGVLGVPRAPLVAFDPVETDGVTEFGAGAAAGAGAGVALGAGVDVTGGSEAGGAAGVAGVPNVAGVHAHDSVAPTIVTKPANIATEMNRPRLRTTST